MMELKNMLKILPKSLWVTTCNSGSCNGCDIEIVATLGPRYDIERFGMKLVGSPRHADVLLVTGPVTKFMTGKLKRIYAQIPDPKVVIVVGNCGSSGDVFFDSYNLDGPVDEILPVDVYVHGCPPRPEAIIEGVAKAVLKLESLRHGSGERQGKTPPPGRDPEEVRVP
jgi:membrane-bound hydrogenase subunit mbhJ